VKIAVFAPMPSASVITAIKVKPGYFREHSRAEAQVLSQIFKTLHTASILALLFSLPHATGGLVSHIARLLGFIPMLMFCSVCSSSSRSIFDLRSNTRNADPICSAFDFLAIFSPLYWYFRATRGSTFDARRAGR
jgi:hypothetical protein